MHRFQIPQTVFRVGDVEIGGQPGELPPVLIGSLFHQGHGIVTDRRSGSFDVRKARALLAKQDRMSNRTGIPCMVDLVAETKEAMAKCLEFVADNTPSPILVNSQDPEVRVFGVYRAKEAGILDRVVYDSINFHADEHELESIRCAGVEAALVQAFNPRNPFPEGMVEVLRGFGGNPGLLEKSRRAGITKPLLFAPVLDLPSIGLAARGVYLFKCQLGLPSGTAPVGVVGRSTQLGRFGSAGRRSSRSSVVALCRALGSDFIIYGSISRAGEIFPACGVIEAAVSYNARAMGIRPRAAHDPLRAIFGRGSQK